MAIVPGQAGNPGEGKPMLADEPLPPGHGDIAQQVEDLDKRIREAGPDEVQAADEAADQDEGDASDAVGSGTSDSDGTSDEQA